METLLEYIQKIRAKSQQKQQGGRDMKTRSSLDNARCAPMEPLHQWMLEMGTKKIAPVVRRKRQKLVSRCEISDFQHVAVWTRHDTRNYCMSRSQKRKQSRRNIKQDARIEGSSEDARRAPFVLVLNLEDIIHGATAPVNPEGSNRVGSTYNKMKGTEAYLTTQHGCFLFCH